MGAHLMTALAAPTIGLILALLLMFWGWRGKRIDNHPICRRCGFDLFGLPPDSHRCSECGHDLNLPKSTRIGNRRKRGLIMTTGILLFLSMAGWFGTSGWHAVSTLGAQKKPVWWLMMDTRSTTPTVAAAAMNELMRRWQRGKLSEKQTDAIIDRVLDFLGGPNKPWESAWRKIIEDTHARGRLTDARWQRYWQQVWTFQLRVRSKVRRGAPIPLELYTTEVWGLFSEVSEVRFQIVSLSIDGNACEPPQMGAGWRDIPNWAIQGRHDCEGLVELRPQLLSRLNDGQHKISAVVNLVVRKEIGSHMQETARTRVPAEGTFDLVPASPATSSEKAANSTRPTSERP